MHKSIKNSKKIQNYILEKNSKKILGGCVHGKFDKRI